jgi:hypothetical protein
MDSGNDISAGAFVAKGIGGALILHGLHGLKDQCHKYLSPSFSSLYPTDVTFENPFINIEILGSSEVGGK